MLVEIFFYLTLHFLFFFFYKFIYLFVFLSYKFIYIYLFLAALHLRCCARALPSCGRRGPRLDAVHGPLTAAASPAAEHGLQVRGLH